MGYALRGDRTAAIEWGTRAVETLPPSLDAFVGPGRLVGLANICIILGERGAAIETLDQVLSFPNPLSVDDLKFDPWHDLLQDRSGFQALLEKHEK